MTVAVAVKLVPTRPETGGAGLDGRYAGISAADRAAVATALALAAALGDDVVAVSAGPPAVDAGLRVALAAGAARAVRVDMAAEPASRAVAAGLGSVLTTLPSLQAVCCGDWSLDRGSGAVPAFLAAELGVAQALGLTALDTAGAAAGRLDATRRLDRGRRERLAVDLPAVLSLDGGAAALPRAPLPALLAADAAAVEVVAPPPAPAHPVVVTRTAPFRPRARVHTAPDPHASTRDRIVELAGGLVGGGGGAARVLTTSPGEAADVLLDQLREWGYLP